MWKRMVPPAERADEQDRAHLDCEFPTAVLGIEEVAYEQNGAAVIWAVHRALTEEFRYINEVR